MQRSLMWMTQGFGLYLFYGIVAVVVCFYMIFRPRDVRAIYRLRRHLGKSPWSAAARVYGNFYQFGRIIIDRFSTYGGRRFEIIFDQRQAYKELMHSEEGFVQFSSHVGNYELAGYTLSFEHKSLYALVYAGETQTVMQNRQRLFGEHRIHMVPVMKDMSHLFTLSNALSKGDTTSLPADRIFGSPKHFRIPFLGQEASFPIGPFALAVQHDVKAVAMFVVKEPRLRYRILLRELPLTDEERQFPARERMQRLAEKYVAQLEQVVRTYPSQWFNFYDFWT